MTNKLSSVIEETKIIVEITANIHKATASQLTNMIVENIISAIIEDMEKDINKLRKHRDKAKDDIETYKFYEGGISELNIQIMSLKQAREEIFTSTAQ